MKSKLTISIMALLCALFLSFGPAVAQQQSQDGGQQQARQSSGGGQDQAAQSETEGAQLYVSPATLRYIQKELNIKGFSTGAVDGVWDDATSQAVLKFQRIQGLEPTGNLNLETLDYLGVIQALRQEPPSGDLQEMVWAESVGEGAPLYVSPTGVRQIQEQLSQSGFDPGPIDGIMGPNTRQALSRYQEEQGISPTDSISLRMISSIGLNNMIAGLTEQDAQRVAQQDQQQVRGYYGPEGEKTDSQQEWEQRSGREGTISLFGPERQEYAGEGARLFVSAEVVRQIQEKLNQAGFEAGNTEGRWDNATSQAMRNYQEANNLEPTGNLNIRTMNAVLGGLSAELLQGGQQGQQGQQNQQQQNQQNQQGQQQ